MDRRLDRLYPKAFTIPALAVYLVFFVLPVAAAFVLGFTDWNIDRIFRPKFNGLDNFIYLFTNEYFGLALKNTFIYAFLTAFFKVLFGLILAIALHRKLYTRNILRTVFYMPAVLSMVVVAIMFSSLLRMDGLVNQLLGHMGLEALQLDWLGDARTALYCAIAGEVWKWSGFTMAIFIAGLQGIGEEYYEAARIDGASALQQFRNVTLPLLAPAMTVAVTINAIGSLKVFEQVFVMTAGGPGFASQVLGTYIFVAFSEGTLGRSTAMGLVQFALITIIAVILNGYLKRREVEM